MRSMSLQATHDVRIVHVRTIRFLRYVSLKLEFHGTDPTPTLGMRLSCNFVNVYSIVYSTRSHVYTRASLTDILARTPRKSARVGQVGGQVGEDRRACPARGKLNGEVPGHADFRARILARKSARMSVSVSVQWNSSLTQLRHIISISR